MNGALTRPLLAERAVSAGLVDALAYEDQLDDHGAMSSTASVEGKHYAKGRAGALGRRGPRIAVIYVTGIIASGDNRFDPLNGEIAGSVQLVEAIRSARADDRVRAIVLRIDSPGGSSIASDVIWREVSLARRD